MSNTPYFTKDRVERPWYVVDLEGQVLGRAAAGVAKLLIGKTEPTYTPGQDCGAFVVVLNAAKIAVTGRKLQQKTYYHHSGYPGGITARTLQQRLGMQPNEVFRDAVKNMLPHNKIGKRLITKLKIYAGGEHPHSAQMPKEITVEQLAVL
jgi:large subunit ribosomal protein L13